MKSPIQKEHQEELNDINKEFHEVIARKKHCYERGEQEGGDTCDCAFFYNKWVQTKKKHTQSSG